MTSPNCYYLGDVVELSMFGTNPHTIPVRIAAFKPSGSVHVVALDWSDDPEVENEWSVPYGWLRRPTTRMRRYKVTFARAGGSGWSQEVLAKDPEDAQEKARAASIKGGMSGAAFLSVSKVEELAP